MSRLTRATINLTALKNNLSVAKKFAPAQKIMAVVKADAYGHGIERIAKSLSEVLENDEAFAVASIDEAIMLRAVGIKHTVFILEGFNSPSDLTLLVEHNLTAVVHHLSQISLLEANPDISKNLKIWIKIDTGMHRLGFSADVVKKVYQSLLNIGVDTQIGLMTHFANADAIGHEKNEHQLNTFNNLIAGNPAETSLANSAAILSFPAAHGHWVRPGIMLYGINPFVKQSRGDATYGLLPVMTLSASLIAVNKVLKDETVGYGSSWVCPEDMFIGIVSIGYGDGYPRHAPPGTPVLVNGKRVNLIGRVSMDMIMVDLRQQPEAKVGDDVVLWGEGLPIEEIADAAGTIGYELLCGVTKRVLFDYKENELI